MILALVFVIALVSWSLYLMSQAIERQEFSLMLAGCLVAASAAATVGVCFLMNNYIDYMAQLSRTPYLVEDSVGSSLWAGQVNDAPSFTSYSSPNL
jgi:hypothetical protein